MLCALTHAKAWRAPKVVCSPQSSAREPMQGLQVVRGLWGLPVSGVCVHVCACEAVYGLWLLFSGCQPASWLGPGGVYTGGQGLGQQH